VITKIVGRTSTRRLPRTVIPSSIIVAVVEAFIFLTYCLMSGWSANTTFDVVSSGCVVGSKCLFNDSSSARSATKSLSADLYTTYEEISFSFSAALETPTFVDNNQVAVAILDADSTNLCYARLGQTTGPNTTHWLLQSGSNFVQVPATYINGTWVQFDVFIDKSESTCVLYINDSFVGSINLDVSGFTPGNSILRITTAGNTTAREKWVDNIVIYADDGAPDPLPDVIFGGLGTTTQIAQLNYPANNMQGATSSVAISFDYIVGTNIVPSHAGVEIVRYLPSGFTYAPIEEAVTASGRSTFTDTFEPDFTWSPYNQYFRWRAYLRDSNNNRISTSEWRYFTTSTTTPVADPNSTPAWEHWYDYSSTTPTQSDIGYINDAYDRCDEFDDNLGTIFIAQPICKFIVFLFVPQNSYSLGEQLLDDAKGRVPFSYVAAVTDTVTLARSEYYTEDATFPGFVLDTGTSSAIDIQFAVLSKENIEAIAGDDTIPQFRIIMQYALWLLFMSYAFFVGVHEIRRLTR